MESQNFGHMHTMVFNEERGNETKEAHCGICVEMVSGPCFICAECGFSPSYLHIKCALFTLSIAGKKPEELKHIATIDPPVLPGEGNKSSENYVFFGCQEPLGESTYISSDCGFNLHKKCAQLPHEINHPFHKQHHLVLQFNGERSSCNICQQTRDRRFLYCCSPCKFALHIKCAELPSKISSPSHRRHPLVLQSNHENIPCKCAMREGWYVVIEAKNLDEELDDDLASINPITRVIELNEAGEMTRIKHFSHAHDLILSDNFMDNDKTYHPGRRWNGLIHIYEDSSLLSATFSNADFAIVRVAALPINLMCDEHPLALTYLEDNDYSEYLHCNICEKRRDQNHWFYHCAICDFSAHPQCVPQSRLLIKPGSTYKAEGHHPHPLTFVRKPHYYLRCSKCSNLCQDLALQCADSTCNYTVHWGCVKPVDFDPDKPVAFYKTQSDC
ncbi:uncharacterized protein LOC120151917 [Hibiscus syriacus]|uniref:uncharacterized protein LOC120151917 n=1 Tax=Hibiscus syriacus TaxID=106335 RepID=UPI00192320A0|nr:uncharacterized protein LOC120151917 [Hibiscus syriacus]